MQQLTTKKNFHFLAILGHAKINPRSASSQTTGATRRVMRHRAIAVCNQMTCANFGIYIHIYAYVKAHLAMVE